MKTKILLATALVAIFPTSAIAQRVAAPSILIVDTGRVLRDCTACVSATAALRAQETAFQQRRQALLAPLQTESQSISQAAQAAVALTGAARTNAEAALRPRVESLRQREQAAVAELQRLQQTFESTRLHVSMQLSQRLDPIYTAVMNARGANLVLSTDARLAHGPGLDVTDQVLASLNQQVPAVSVTPMPQQPGATPGVPPTPPATPRPGGR